MIGIEVSNRKLLIKKYKGGFGKKVKKKSKKSNSKLGKQDLGSGDIQFWKFALF